ncbi:MAG: hypothetical protein AAFQ94_02015 [Bacteroidota bacterium]
MIKVLLLVLFFLPAVGLSQDIDYSQLSRKEKLKFLNYYGYVILNSQDTIYAEVKIDKSTNTPIITRSNQLTLTYPGDLEKYAYKTKVSLDSIKCFYFGYPRKLNVVKLYDGKSVNLEKIAFGRYELYKEVYYEKEPMHFLTSMPDSNTSSSSTGKEIIEVLYISKKNGKLHRLDGDRQEKKKMLATLFEGDLSEKKLSKIKTANYKVIELVNRLNAN